MSADKEPATVPACEDPSVSRRTEPARRRRLAARYLSAAMLLSVACSRLTTPSTGGSGNDTSASPQKQKSAETSKPQAVQEYEQLDHQVMMAQAERETEAAASNDTPPISKEEKAAAKAPASPPPGKPKTDSRRFGIAGPAASGAGLAGIGQGGGGRLSTASRRPMALAAPAATVAAGPLLPPSEFNTEAYKNNPGNPFRLVKDAPLSTFSVDVDTASYSNMRRFVQEGRLPPADAIRTEEWVNYFGYDDPAPASGEPVAVATELTQCPWASGHELLRVSLTTQPIAQEKVPPRNLVFLVDVSGSMQPANKLPLLKRGLALLARQLRPVDTLSIVVYAGASGVALPPTSGAEQGKILAALDALESGGSTNGAEGIQLAYRMAEQQMKHGGINRVLLATDGDFNVGVTSEGELTRLIEQKRKTGVFLTVLGFGEGNLKDSTMETLADKGNGNYAYIDDLTEARKVLVHEAGATLVTVAQDVKLQLEFNPAHVKGYRLVGYENRVLADQDFSDDTKDAGEMGAGHHVTAFYEIVPASANMPAATPAIDPLKYQTDRRPTSASPSSELLTVKIRYKAPGGTKSLLISRAVADRIVPLASTSESLRFGAAVAEYSLAFRGADGVGLGKLPEARALAMGALGPDLRHERREFVALMDRAVKLPKN
jgi:Ca-activated chloride channel family protein